MMFTKVVKAAFVLCILLSLLLGSLLLFSAGAIKRYARMTETGREIHQLLSQMEVEEKNYLISPEETILDDVRDRMESLRKLASAWENSGPAIRLEGSVGSAMWEEAVDLYERLFDQFVLYRKAVEKNIREIRDLEKRILAVIYSKMNPERGIIALQEIRIHEKGYLIYRNTQPPAHERPFQEQRKEAVSHLLMWAQNDPRIEELIDKDNQLFNQITSNFEGEDHTLILIEREREKIGDIADGFLKEGETGLDIAYKRSRFVAGVLLAMWVVMGVAIGAATAGGRGR